MNKKRRDDLREAMTFLDNAKEIVSGAAFDEEDYMENMPENLKYSVRYDDAESAVDSLQEAISHIENATESIMEAM